jgi:hypothetical protein
MATPPPPIITNQDNDLNILEFTATGDVEFRVSEGTWFAQTSPYYVGNVDQPVGSIELRVKADGSDTESSIVSNTIAFEKEEPATSIVLCRTSDNRSFSIDKATFSSMTTKEVSDFLAAPDTDFHSVITLSQGLPFKINMYLQARSGDILNLTGLSVKLTAYDMLNPSGEAFSKDLVISADPTVGRASLTFDGTEDIPSGIHHAELTVLNGAGIPIDFYRFYVEVQQQAFYGNFNKERKLSIAEVRMELFDRSSEDNDLLDSVEFTDEDIIFSLRKIVELWNTTQPVIQSHSHYGLTDFPYVLQGINGACGDLMRRKMIQLQRNRLAFSTGSGAVDDSSRADFYAQMGTGLLSEYREFIRIEKHRINANNCFGGTRRPTNAMHGSF